MIENYCILRKVLLPCLPCEEKDTCEWYVHDQAYNNCFWVLANALAVFPKGLSIEEIAKLENLSVEEVETILEKAIIKYRSNLRKFVEKNQEI